MDFDRDSVKIFLFFLLLFGVFGHWIGSADNTSIATTVSLAEEGNWDLNEFRPLESFDYVKIGEHYYGDVPPVISILGVPIYLISKLLLVNPGFENELYRWFSIFLVSSLPGSYLMALIYKNLDRVNPKESERVFTTLLIGLGTLIFAYSTVLYTLPLACLLSYLSYLKLSKGDITKKDYLTSGILGGLALSTHYAAIFVLTGLAFYLISSYEFPRSLPEFKNILKQVINDSNLPIWSLGIFLGSLPLLIFHYLVSGNPLTAPIIFTAESSIFQITGLSLVSKLLGVYLYPYRGLLYWTPLLIPAFIGLKYLYKRNKEEFIVAATSISFFTIFSLFYSLWFRNTSFGPSYFLIIIPFLSTALLLSYQKAKKSKALYLFIALAAISVANNLLSITRWGLNTEIGRKGLVSSSSKFLTGYSPLYANNLEQVLSQGIPSTLLNGLVYPSEFSTFVNSKAFVEVVLANYGENILMLNTKWLWVSLAIILSIFVFKNSLKKELSYSTFKIILILGVALFLSGFEMRTGNYSGWYDSSSDDVKWGDQNATYSFLSNKETARIIQFEARAMEDTELRVYSNDNLAANEKLYRARKDYSAFIKSKKGFNTIKFNTEAGCKVIGEITNSSDSRCVSVGIRNLKILNETKNGIYSVGLINISKGYRTSSDGSLLLIGDGKISIDMSLKSWGGEADIEVFDSNRKIAETNVDQFGHRLSLPYSEINGSKVLKLKVDCSGNCDYIKLQDMEIKKWNEQSNSVHYRTGENWYRNISTERYIWSSGNSSIYFYNYQSKPVDRKIALVGRSFGKTRNMTFKWKGKILDSKTIEKTENEQSFNVDMEPGENIMRIESENDCLEMGQINNNNDIRCGFFGLRSIDFGANIADDREGLTTVPVAPEWS